MSLALPRLGGLARGTLAVFGWYLARLGAQLAWVVLMARTLGVDGYGMFSGVAGLARVVSTAADIGATRSYKAITAGESLDSASAVDFSDTGIGLKPLAPVHINAGRDAAGNIIITWVRRTRGQCWEAEPRLQGQLYSFDPTRQLPFQAAGGRAPGRGSACIQCPATRIGSIPCPGFA